MITKCNRVPVETGFYCFPGCIKDSSVYSKHKV